MKILKAIAVVGVMLLYSGMTFGEVVINEVGLKWQDVSRQHGDALYSNLCSVCHGLDGKGDGSAVSAMEKGVPDLTVLSANNGGSFPYKKVENVICGKSRDIAHGTIDMPNWEQQFASLRPGWTSFSQRAYVRGRVYSLAAHIETIQLNMPADVRVAKVD